MDKHQSDDPGRRQRFEALAGEVYEPLQRYARRRVDHHEVDDIVADTLMTLWRRLDDVPADARLPWAYGIARRHIANHRRAAGRHLSLVRRVAVQPQPTVETDGPLDVELHTALEALDDHDRELLRLWAWEQLEPAEMATVLGVTTTAATIRLHRAKKKLGKKLENMRKSEAFSGHSHRESRKEEQS